jgi:hypothetical protein
VDNFVDTTPPQAVKARKIKALAVPPKKSAFPQIVKNQPLTCAIGFVAVRAVAARSRPPATQFLCISQAGVANFANCPAKGTY